MSAKVWTYMAVADSATDSATNYECCDCGKMFRRDAALRRHREVSHAAAADDATARRYRCQTCRRPFTNRSALNTHVTVAHGFSATRSSTMNTDNPATTAAKQFDGNDAELLLVEDCCVDDEICIAADGGSADFQTEECDSCVTENNCDEATRHNCTFETSLNSSAVDTASSAVSVAPTSVSVPSCNNNNSQTKNKNVSVHPALTTSVNSRTAVRSAVGSSDERSSDVKVPTVSLGMSVVQTNGMNGVATCRKPQFGTTTATTATASSSAATSSQLVSVCRSALETSTRGTVPQRAATHATPQQKNPKSPMELSLIHI